jgi:teichuronic acid biosynthesis glycosyltransferase TuaG
MLVSVILPAFNAEKYIGQSIQSVLAQTYPNYELIVVDDGSTDSTAQVVRSFHERRIHYLHKPNNGLPSARNTGIQAAKGELVAFLDSDDLWMERKLELQVDAFEREAADIIYCDGFVFHDDKSMDESVRFGGPGTHMRFGRIAGDEMFKFLFPMNCIPVLTVLARKSSIERAGRFDESLRLGLEDYDLWLRLAHNRAIFYGIDQPLVRYRVHPQGMSQRVLNMLRGEIAVMEKQRHAPEISRAVRRERLRALYENAITALIENGMTGEARKFLLWRAWRERLSLLPVVEALLIGMLPQKHVALHSFLQRIQASVAYRIGRPAKALSALVRAQRRVD